MYSCCEKHITWSSQDSNAVEIAYRLKYTCSFQIGTFVKVSSFVNLLLRCKSIGTICRTCAEFAIKTDLTKHRRREESAVNGKKGNADGYRFHNIDKKNFKTLKSCPTVVNLIC